MRSIKRISLVLFVALLLAVLKLESNISPVHAAAQCGQCLKVQSVYTTDPSNNNKTTFVPGEGIWLHVDATSDSDTKISVDVQFEVFYTGNEAPLSPFGYNKTEHADMPPGLSRFYTPITIANNATPGEYTVRIQVSDRNNPDDDPWNSNNITVQKSGSSESLSPMQYCTQYLPESTCIVLTNLPEAANDDWQRAKDLLGQGGQLAHKKICDDPTWRSRVLGPNPELIHAVCGNVQ